jgi:hypothetical protein
VKDAEWCRAFGTKDPACVNPVKRATVKPAPTRILPPAEYDKPYAGQLELVVVDSQDDVRARCESTRGLPIAIACSMHTSDHCRIIIANERVIASIGHAYSVVMRHELAHCNGWPGNHPGALPWEDARPSLMPSWGLDTRLAVQPRRLRPARSLLQKRLNKPRQISGSGRS